MLNEEVIGTYHIVESLLSMSDLGILQSSNILSTSDSIHYTFNTKSNDLLLEAAHYNIGTNNLDTIDIYITMYAVKSALGLTDEEMKKVNNLRGNSFYVWSTEDPINTNELDNMMRRLILL